MSRTCLAFEAEKAIQNPLNFSFGVLKKCWVLAFARSRWRRLGCGPKKISWPWWMRKAKPGCPCPCRSCFGGRFALGRCFWWLFLGRTKLFRKPAVFKSRFRTELWIFPKCCFFFLGAGWSLVKRWVPEAKMRCFSPWRLRCAPNCRPACGNGGTHKRCTSKGPRSWVAAVSLTLIVYIVFQ